MTRDDGLVFLDGAIRFPPDAWTPGVLLAAAEIRDFDPGLPPPELRTVWGETRFLSSPRRPELERFCARHGIARRSRPDVWGDLLEPFLDTSSTPAERAATLARLAAAGVGATEAARIRERVGPLLSAYNALHWDWHHLGLADLLDAATAPEVPEELRIPPTRRDAFRAWAMEIADRPVCAGPVRAAAGREEPYHHAERGRIMDDQGGAGGVPLHGEGAERGKHGKEQRREPSTGRPGTGREHHAVRAADTDEASRLDRPREPEHPGKRRSEGKGPDEYPGD